MPLLAAAAAANVAVAAVGWVMAPMLTKLVNKVCSSAAACKYYLHTGLEEKLRHLSEEVDNINDDLKSRARSKDVVVVNEDLLQLKDAIHDAVELLNMLNDQAKSANKANILKTIIGNRKSVKKVDELLADLQQIPPKLKFLTPTPQAPQRRPGFTGQTALGSEMVEFYGYGGEYSALRSSLLQQEQEEDDAQVVGRLGLVGIYSILGHIHSLLKAVLWQHYAPCHNDDTHTPTPIDSSSPPAHYQVVALIGYGGLGKTELARWAFYRDQGVMANFGIRIWVCVYAKFTETDLLRAICESASTSGAAAEDDDDDDDDEVKTIERLQEQLTDILKKKPDSRFLLVLDDVCNDESAAAIELMSRSKTWDVVLAPFKQHEARGSRILITTRAGICATTLEAGVRIVLDGIHADAMELLIQKKAGGKQGEAPLWLNELHGSPLAGQEVGTNLAGKIGSRSDMIEKEMENIMKVENLPSVHETHYSSYQDLPPHLQRCFAFCSLFPKKWRFEHKKLVQMWAALGFIEDVSESHGDTMVEKRAMGYFDALLERSLFREVDRVEGESGPDHRYVIHEHIHSMLRRKACPDGYFVSIDGSCQHLINDDSGLLRARHVSVTTDCLDKLMADEGSKAKKLRTLLVFQDSGAAATWPPSTSAPSMTSTTKYESILKKFKGVRVLDLSDTGIAEAPESIRKLKNLRYLGLPSTSTVSKGIAQMVGIGNMKLLQGSVEFDASNRKKGHSMRELGELNSLRGTLGIKGLETVGSKKEAESAHLERKDGLEALKLEWDHRSEHKAKSCSDSNVLEGLQPHPNLQELHITRYQGEEPPRWLAADARVLQNLRSLCLRNCRKLVALPPVGGLPWLQVLDVKELCSVERIDGAFCGSGAFKSLEKMVLHDMPALLAWDAVETSAGGDTPPILFPKLRKVEIVDCPNLVSLLGLLCCRDSLGILSLKRCPAVAEKFRRSRFPSLKTTNIHIHECPGLQLQ